MLDILNHMTRREALSLPLGALALMDRLARGRRIAAWLLAASRPRPRARLRGSHSMRIS